MPSASGASKKGAAGAAPPSTKMTFSTVFQQSSAGAVGMARGISFSFAAKSTTTTISSSKPAVARASITGSIGFTVVPSSQSQQSQPSPVVGLTKPPARASKGKGSGQPRKVVVGGTVLEAAPPAVDIPVTTKGHGAYTELLMPLPVPLLGWADEATRDQFGAGGTSSGICGGGADDHTQLLAPTPVSCSSTSLGPCTDSSNFSSKSSCPSYFGEEGDGVPEAFGLDEDTELMAFLESSPLGPEDLTLLPLSPPPRMPAPNHCEARSSSGSTTSSSDRSSKEPAAPSPVLSQEKPPLPSKPKRAAASRAPAAARIRTTTKGKGKETGTNGTTAAPPPPAPAPTRSFVSSPFQVVKKPTSATGSPSSPSTAARFSFRELNDRIRSPSITASLAAPPPTVRRCTSDSSTASCASTTSSASSTSSSGSSSHRTIKTVLVGGQQHGTGAWSVCKAPSQPPAAARPTVESTAPAAVGSGTGQQQQQMEPPLLLEGKPFRFEVDGDDTDDEFEGLLGGGGEGQDGEDFLSSSTLEILIEHFSSDGLSSGGADGPAFENDSHAPLFGVVAGEGEENARDAFAPSLEEA